MLHGFICFSSAARHIMRACGGINSNLGRPPGEATGSASGQFRNCDSVPPRRESDPAEPRRFMNLHNLHLIIVFALVIAAFVAFIREWLSPDLVALSAMVLLLATGVLSTDEALSV